MDLRQHCKKKNYPQHLQHMIHQLIIKGIFDKDQLLGLLASHNIAYDDLDVLDSKCCVSCIAVLMPKFVS